VLQRHVLIMNGASPTPLLEVSVWVFVVYIQMCERVLRCIQSTREQVGGTYTNSVWRPGLAKVWVPLDGRCFFETSKPAEANINEAGRAVDLRYLISAAACLESADNVEEQPPKQSNRTVPISKQPPAARVDIYRVTKTGHAARQHRGTKCLLAA